MKKTITTIAVTIIFFFLFSCQKEKISDSLEQNRLIDQELFAGNIGTDAQIADFAKRKTRILQRIQQDYPMITMMQVYPNLAGTGDPDQKTANKTDCMTMFNNSYSACNTSFQADMAGAAPLTSPVGGLSFGTGLVEKATKQYTNCKNSAITARDNCMKTQK